ncbi:MAG TPA: hypothetical protein VIG99_00820 [Myxococcaceae bacterium]|jgi:hypothetical protein
MKPRDLNRYAGVEALRRASAAGLARGRHMHRGGPAAHGPSESLRVAEYRGHRVEVWTTYQVSIDGEAIGIPFHVADDGTVICHAVPTYTSTSALDVAKRIVDAYPHRYPARRRAGRRT